MKFSALILRNLARKIEYGYPVTALATANNYLDINCPLRQALVAKARQKIKFTNENHKAIILQKVFSGESLADCELSESIRFYDLGIRKFCKKVPSKFGRISFRRRLSSKKRTNGRYFNIHTGTAECAEL